MLHATFKDYTFLLQKKNFAQTTAVVAACLAVCPYYAVAGNRGVVVFIQDVADRTEGARAACSAGDGGIGHNTTAENETDDEKDTEGELPLTLPFPLPRGGEGWCEGSRSPRF